jgi:hypothetical protein
MIGPASVWPSISEMPPWICGGSGFTRAPWLTRTKFCKRIDMPIAVINGARRNDPRNGR